MLVLCGIYGTRQVERLSIKAFEDNDREPQVFGVHLQGAMQQLWGQPEEGRSRTG